MVTADFDTQEKKTQNQISAKQNYNGKESDLTPLSSLFTGIKQYFSRYYS